MVLTVIQVISFRSTISCSSTKAAGTIDQSERRLSNRIRARREFSWKKYVGRSPSLLMFLRSILASGWYLAINGNVS